MKDVLGDVARVRSERDLLERNDAEAAVERLLVISGYLTRGEVVPANLAKYLAKAIEGSMRGSLQVDRKRDALLQALGLMAMNKRAISQSQRDAIGWAMFKQVSNGASMNSAALGVALELDVGETTAKRCFEELIAKLVEDKDIG